MIWERVNEQRHGRYIRDWKAFYRRWRQVPDWEWPTSEQFWQQHRRLVKAVRECGLPPDPIGSDRREDLVAAALVEVQRLDRATETEIAEVCPPVEELLP